MAHENKFKVGQVVQLKSGGPKMTVECRIDNLPDESEVYTCQWFAAEKLEQGKFSSDLIEPIEPVRQRIDYSSLKIPRI
jgi:uncharacterized protein YodC (DUF2158 family)